MNFISGLLVQRSATSLQVKKFHPKKSPLIGKSKPGEAAPELLLRRYPSHSFAT